MKIYPALLFCVILVAGAAAKSYAAADTATVVSSPAAQDIPKGIVICEPVNETGNEELGNVMAGASAWLHFVVAGKPEMTLTPTWHHLPRICIEMHRTDLRLAADTAPVVSSMFGVPCVAIGRLTGVAAPWTLQYTIYDKGGDKINSAPLSISGTEDELLSKMPDLATQFDASLGVSDSAIPPFDLTKQDALNIAKWRWSQRASLDSDATAVVECAQRTVLGEVVALYLHNIDEPASAFQWAKIRASKNALGYNEVVLASGGSISDPDIDNLLAGHPTNLVLLCARVKIAEKVGDRDQATAIADHIVQAAPLSPDAWRTAMLAYEDCAEKVRQGSVAVKISDANWKILGAYYDTEMKYSTQAVKLDPNYEAAWREQCRAATFAGRNEVATTAFWKAAKLNPYDGELISWGLEMFQPKWLDQPDDMMRVIRLIRDTPGFTTNSLIEGITNHFPTKLPGLQRYRRALTEVVVEHLKQDLKTSSDKSYELSSIGNAYSTIGDKAMALSYYQQAEKASPGDETIQGNVADELSLIGRFAESVTVYSKLLKSNPRNAQYLIEYAWALDGAGRLKQSELEMRKAVSIDGSSRLQDNLANLLYKHKKYDDAEKAMRIATKEEPIIGWSWDLGKILVAEKKYQEGISKLVEALSDGSFPMSEFDTSILTQAFYDMRDFDDCIKVCKIISVQNPNDHKSCIIQAKAYFALGDKANAISTLANAVHMYNDPDAKALLAKLKKPKH